MVTKGIITSIDFNGNTCQVRIPLFETAGNDPITGTAIVSNTPGSYNGYKVGDVVLVAFEDGKMETPVVIGKLYLGAAKEKQDPRGTINVETTTASKSASLPADAVLTANVDSNVPNTNTPFGSLASIANNLNSLNTDVNQLDRFTRNQFNSVITDVNDQGEQLRSEIKQTAENIEANVVHKHKDGSQKGLGWDLDEKEWKINAKDTVVNGVVKDINIVTITREGMSIAGDLKLNGYPKNIIVRYAQNGSDKDYPYLYNFKQANFPDTKIDKTWYHDKYIKITEADKEKYILISNENIDDYTIVPGETVAYVYNLKEINPEWKTETPARVDGQYIWQWTHTESFSFNGDSWDEKDDDKVVCITGAKGDTGTAAVSTWLAVSNPVHTGKNQQTPITIKALKQIGDAANEELAVWFLVDGATPTFSNPTSTLTLNKETLAETNVIIKASFTKDDFDNKKYFEEETITFSPLNTPVLDLSNDGDFLPYNSSGTKIGDNSVSSTAAVYFNGVKVENPGEFIWKVYKVEGENKTELTASTDTDQWSINGDTISVSKISTTNWEAVCSIAYTWNGITTNLSKTFSITKQIQGEDAVDYYLNISSFIHTGETQTSNISIEAKKRIGVSGLEEPDTAAYLYWRYANQSTWTTGSDGKITIEIPFNNQDIELIAARKSLGTNISSSNENVYEVETITYSPLNTPVIDLSNDTDDLSYDASGANKIDNDESVTSTARLYLNGKEITSNLAYAWTIPNGVTATGYNTNTITVSGLSSQSAAITCTITIGDSGIDGKFANLKYSKVFTVTKKLKGSPGTPGTPGDTGVGISECKTYYSLSNIPTGPTTVDDNGNENIASTPAVNTWSTSPQAFDKDKYQGYEYWTVERRVYTNGNVVWGAPVKASMLSADFINSLGITAKKLLVKNDNKETLLDAGWTKDTEVNIGGFTVNSNKLYAGNPGTSNSIELASSHKLIAYKSNNKGVASSYAVSKITVNKATDLTVYIRSYAESNFDYTMISNPNVSSYPKSYSSSDVRAHTRSKQNSSSALAGYTKVEYYGLKQNDWIYVVYSKDKNTDLGTDTGYLLIPETTDISIEAVDDTNYTFERDPLLDTKEAGASLKVGSNFSVDSTGAIKSTSGTIGGFEVTSDDLHTAGKTIGDPNSLFLSSTGITDRSSIGGSSGDQTWSITAGGSFGVTKSGTVYANDMVITAGYADTIDTIRIGTAWAGMYFQNIYNGTDKNDCYVRANEIKNTGRNGYNIVFNDSQDKNYSASINIMAKKPATSGPYIDPHYAWEQGIELKTYNPADKTSGASANNAALRIGYYKGNSVPSEAKKDARGFLGDVWCPTGIFRCKNGNIVPYIYGFKSGLLDIYSDEFEYGFYFDSERLEGDSWASWYYGDTFTGISCVIVSLGRGTMYEGDTRPGDLSGSKGNENPFYFDDHINKWVYWYNDTGKPWTVDVFIVGYKQRAAGTFIGEQEIK